MWQNYKYEMKEPSVVAHAYNPNYLGNRDWDHSSWPVGAKSYKGPYLNQ
jgi:hypothetical protein